MEQLSMFADPVDERVRDIVNHRLNQTNWREDWDIKKRIDWWLDGVSGGYYGDFTYEIRYGTLYADTEDFNIYDLPKSVHKYTKADILDIWEQMKGE